MTDKEQIMNNFAKDINVPSKEQIIIDGINVTDCNYIIAYDPPEWQGTWGGAIHKGACKIYSKDCKYNSNCYFKSLARKTQECESLKQEIEILQNNYDTATRDCNEEIARLEQVCEELKEEYTELKLENKELYRILADLKEVRKLKDRYRNALEEIEGIVTEDYYDDNWADITIKIDSIRNIINKAKGEK